MLRIGKNPNDSVANDTSSEKESPYNKAYQGTAAADTRTQPDYNPSASRAITEGESIARELKEGNLSGFVGSGTLVTGEASFKALMRVDGHLSGKITSSGGTLIVGANGKVDANIEVAIAMIHGTVNGDIIASQRLEIGRAGKVSGNIQTPSLVIEQGALFEGTSKMMKMNAAAESKTKTNGRDDQPLDATTIKPVNVDSREKSTEISSALSTAS